MLTVILLVRGANHMSGRRDPAGLDRAKTGSVLLVGRNELALPKWLRRDGHRRDGRAEVNWLAKLAPP